MRTVTPAGRLAGLLTLALTLVACGCSAASSEAPASIAASAKSAAGHPRLIVRRQDLARLRSWASRSNPMYSKGIAVLAGKAKRDMNAGKVPGADGGSYSYERYPSEAYAELFAFMSLIDPSPSARADYGHRARKLLMAVITEAEQGASGDTPFRDPSFSISDRSRWQGEAFGLTVDWAYPYFSAGDKKQVRKVFLRWAKEQYGAFPLTELEGPKPTPDGARNAPTLLSNRRNVRYSMNNYYIAHARNLGLMAMALDPRDDPGAQLRSQLKQVTGQWLFIIDRALRTDARGGLSPEGFEYGPDAMGRLAQLLASLRTAGKNGDQSSPQTKIDGNPFWSESITAFLQSLPPNPTRLTGEESYRGDIWQPASFGDEQEAWAADPIALFGPLALNAAEHGDTETVNAVRWISTNIPEGGKAKLLDRVSNTDQFLDAIFYYLVFDPTAAEPTDPRPKLDNRYFAPGLNRTLARTCTCADGRMFAHKLTWNAIDHETADGNDFAFHRKGEWLTKNRSSYESIYTDYTNNVTIGNDAPAHNAADDPRRVTYERGGQYVLTPSGDPTLTGRSFGKGFVALTGDATNLYNSDYEGVHGVTHSSRSILWLEPDHIVVYDRATTTKPGRFKRFWLQLPAKADISGTRATVQTPKGQQLFVNTLLPDGAAISSAKNEKDVGQPTVADPMGYRLRVDATGDPQDVRFLHVIQGADGGATADPATLVHSSAGARYDGAVVAGTAVLFPFEIAHAGATSIDLPAGGLKRVLVTGLEPAAGYTASFSDGHLAVSAGGDTTADEGGVLDLTP